jgi:hypothetical protein
MPCRIVQLVGGATALVRHAPNSPRKCSVCGVKTRQYVLCDFPMLLGQTTCDKPLCRSCARHVEPDTDYCPLHAGWVQGKLKL